MKTPRRCRRRWRYALPLSLWLLPGNACLAGEAGTVPPWADRADLVVHHQLSERARLGPQWVQPRGLGIGFVRPEEADLPPRERSQSMEIPLEPGQPFATRLILHAPARTTVLVTLLLDYRQVGFELDGRRGLLHQLVVEPGGDLELPLAVEVPGEGAHDLLVLAFSDPYNPSLDPAYRSSMDERMAGRRAVIRVGGGESPARALGPPRRGRPVPAGVHLSLGVAFADPGAGLHPSRRQLYVAGRGPGEDFHYQVWASNLKGERAAEYALIQFLGFRQVPLDGRDVLPVALRPGQEAIIDAHLTAPASPGVYPLQVVYLLDPYRSLLRREVAAPFVFASPRIAFAIREPGSEAPAPGSSRSP